jgi:hypothetical protein
VVSLTEEEFRRTKDDAETMHSEEEYVFHSDRKKDYHGICGKSMKMWIARFTNGRLVVESKRVAV